MTILHNVTIINILMKIHIDVLRRVIKEELEDDAEKSIAAAMKEKRCKSVDAFIESKIDDDEFEFNFIELQALARNVASARKGYKKLASPQETSEIKKELTDVGLKFIGREPLKKNIRGFTSPTHGSSRFAGMCGGTGFGSDWHGGTFTSFGGGPGAIGGGGIWDPDDPRCLRMGARGTKKKLTFDVMCW